MNKLSLYETPLGTYLTPNSIYPSDVLDILVAIENMPRKQRKAFYRICQEQLDHMERFEQTLESFSQEPSSGEEMG